MFDLFWRSICHRRSDVDCILAGVSIVLEQGFLGEVDAEGGSQSFDIAQFVWKWKD